MTRGRKPRVVKDWVYTGAAYSGLNWTLTAGIAGALAFPLTYSQNARKLAVHGPLNALPGVGNLESWAAIPEGGAQRIFAVDGGIYVDANTWNVGSSFKVGWRLKVFEQDPLDGTALTAPFYSMYTDNTPNGVTIATSANEGYLREKHWSVANVAGTVVTTTSSWYVPIRWRSQRGITLGNNTALFLYLESATGSITLRGHNRMRTLMRAGGVSV